MAPEDRKSTMDFLPPKNSVQFCSAFEPPLTLQQILPVFPRRQTQNVELIMSANPLLHCRNLCCRRPLWRNGDSHVHGINAAFQAGRFHAVCGPPKCGKNLLLHLLGLLESPDDGEILLEETNTTALTEPRRDAMRQRCYGFLFPVSTLLPSLSVLENIAFTVIKAGENDGKRQAEMTLEALHFCGLENEAEQTVSKLPPDRRAVASFARAIAHRPLVLIAETPPDENILVPLARRAVEDLSMTVIWSTEADGPACRNADHVFMMQDGEITDGSR